MNLIKEMIDPNSVVLNNVQQAILLVIKLAATPQIAYENTNVSQQTVTSRNLLNKLGFIQLDLNKTKLTNNGNKALENFGLIQSNQITDLGKQIYDQYIKVNKLKSPNSDNDEQNFN